VEVTRGDTPLVLGFPHTGTDLPPEVRAALNDTGRARTDTDWHVHRLFDGLAPGATTVRATFHRYVIDANRPPDGASLYPGQATTDLIPLTDFDGRPIWDRPPDEAERAARLEAHHAPYHAALAVEMERVRARHGFAVLHDCHSIRSHVPRLFEGRLPDLNVGTNDGATCDAGIEAIVAEACAASPFTSVLNGRFRGGWTTRHYGRPSEGWHAVQLEIAQSTHLAAEAPPFDYDPARADRLHPVLAGILDRLTHWRPA
jgi:formiminoglutamase